jgi:hypothetical protein
MTCTTPCCTSTVSVVPVWLAISTPLRFTDTVKVSGVVM